jgi:hypothetical protein
MGSGQSPPSEQGKLPWLAALVDEGPIRLDVDDVDRLFG